MKKIIIVFLFIFLLFNFGSAYSQDLEMKIIKLKYAQASDLYPIINDLKSEQGKVSFDRNTNSLIISDTPKELERLIKLVNELDVGLKQVEIETTIVEATDDFIKDTGLHTSGIILPADRFFAILSLLESRGDANISVKSKIRTLSNKPARIQLTQEHVIGEDVIIYPSGATWVTPERKEVGSILEVLPRVNPDNTIEVSIRPSLSNLQENTSLPFERSLSTQVVVNDSDTIMLGSLTQEVQRTQTQNIFGVPLTKTQGQGKRKTLIFLTVKIVK